MTMTLKLLSVLSALSFLFGTVASAQTLTQTQDFSSFSRVEASSAFKVTFVQSDTYKAVWTVNRDLKELVQVYVQGETLHAGFLKKSMSPELKKQYKGKNGSVQVLNLVVYAPSLGALSLADEAAADASSLPTDPSSFSLELTGGSSVTNLNLTTEALSVKMDKKSTAAVKASSVKISVSLGNSAALTLNLTQDAETAELSQSGSSVLNFTGNVSKTSLNVGGSSELQLSGKADILEVKSEGSSRIQANDFPVAKAYVTMQNASRLYVNPSEILQVDLKGNSRLVYQNDPVIKIVQIISSSLTRWENEKK